MPSGSERPCRCFALGCVNPCLQHHINKVCLRLCRRLKDKSHFFAVAVRLSNNTKCERSSVVAPSSRSYSDRRSVARIREGEVSTALAVVVKTLSYQMLVWIAPSHRKSLAQPIERLGGADQVKLFGSTLSFR